MLPTLHPKLGDFITQICVGDSKEVARLIEADPSLVNAEHPSGTTPLYFAVRHQAEFSFEHLIDQGAKVNPSLPGRPSLLDMAEALPSQYIFDSLKAAGARTKTARKLAGESTPIYPTIAEHVESDLPLCETINKTTKFKTVAGLFNQRRLRQLLTYACRDRVVPFVFQLISVLPSVSYSTDDEGSPLLESGLSGSLEIVRLFIEAGASRDLEHAFYFAVKRGHVDVAAELLSAARSKSRNFFNREAPAMSLEAAEKGYTAMAELMLPFASKSSQAKTIRRIDEWRAEFFDLVPEHFEWVNDHPSRWP